MRGLTDTLAKAAEHEQLVFLCSFQKEESVILDELLGAAPHTRVVTIDTGVLFPETLQTWRAFEERFGVHVDVEEASGPWTGPENCCGDAKVAALERALSGADPCGRARGIDRHLHHSRRPAGPTCGGPCHALAPTGVPRAVVVEDDPIDAAAAALVAEASGPILIAGSLYLVGAARSHLVDDPDLRDPEPVP